ncbi:carbohydrate ABC transporter permease [Compostimonas suwonensis]|uniref:Lactose/L-arabinose transport system permease protein n=1 Tax=Compostimonas suwonensis TaxID=1048394 RepID=A0A2M9BV97_9MICO|nr:sugar ABC transporter permease [Compostimonas suwonensis]PJJ61871.1 lactose/L-arabinose transport system permease protein [Compostimonas suwonensis]
MPGVLPDATARGAVQNARLPGASRPSRRKINHRYLLFLAPALVLFAVFQAYPIVRSLILSFQSREGGELAWVGFRQYERLIGDPNFWLALGNTLIILVIQVPLMLLIALVVASALRSSYVKLKTGFRLIYFLPAVTALLAYAIVFRALLNGDSGVANQIIGMFGVEPINWLGDPFWARVSLISAVTWRWMGYNMVIMLAGMSSIDPSVREAATMDGANAGQTFRYITVPLLKPVILFCVVTSTIGTLQMFDEPYILTQGGPAGATLTIVLYLYRTAFKSLDFGYASAIAWVLVIIVMIIALIQMRLLRDKDDE